MKVSEVLPNVKANSRTFYNLDKRNIDYFKNQYAYLVRHKDKEIDQFGEQLLPKYLKDNNGSFIGKLTIMQFVATHIIHA